MAVIEAEHVYKVFGRRGREGVSRLEAGETRAELLEDGLTAGVVDASFTVEEGEIFVVMGLSGSGKSTLIRMVNGLLEPTAGHVRVYGDDITAMSPKQLRQVRRDRVSMVFQHFALFPHRTVVENAAFGLEAKGVGRKEREDKAREALSMTGLEGWADQLPAQLSGGMRQRVGLARALAAETDILLMDEAFSALDPLIRREMQDQLLELQHRLGKTVLFITHDLNEAMRIGDRIAMMRAGEIIQVGTAEEILTSPANDYVAQFVADVDRARVLTAGAVMERPVAVLGAEQGPRAALRLMRENQQTSIFVVGRDRLLRGVVHEGAVARALEGGPDQLDGVIEDVDFAIAEDTPLIEVLSRAAAQAVLPVVSRSGKLVGVLPRVTLLSVLGGGNEPDDEEPTETQEVAGVR